MGFLVLLLVLALPVVELAVLIQVGANVGALNTIGLLIVVSLVGIWLAKREGLGVVNRIRRAQDNGEVPSPSAVGTFTTPPAVTPSTLPPESAARSTTTEPGSIRATIEVVTSTGA